MIISKVERVWTIAIALVLLCAACAYTMAISDVVTPALTFMDKCWIYSPTVLLTVYGVLLLCCYRQRGVKWKQGHRVDVSGYQGDKYPWL